MKYKEGDILIVEELDDSHKHKAVIVLWNNDFWNVNINNDEIGSLVTDFSSYSPYIISYEKIVRKIDHIDKDLITKLIVDHDFKRYINWREEEGTY